ncbi:hypothetical protein RO07_09425 [Pandoraea pulmonicola]|uniref:E3 ubiquitin-protein ligase sspH2 n=2 Tax=Pandoraea pulmonicola TaxID=93221 RepID=A0AAJ4ZCP9_PANPU|nr:hypothetical protein RO07_09425 [Pandoraea pulmonicola]SUA90882.1 E3 ubiquitin-protein ligase sspH2 [Pandoraea pulmonicola]
MLEYAGQRDDPDYERRCAALLAALAWTHRQSSQTGGADIESVYQAVTQHLERSCREGVDVEALVDALANLGLENARGGRSREPSPAHVKLARDVLATLETRVNAGQLLREMIADFPAGQAGDGSGIDELYRYSLTAWVAFAPWGVKREHRAIAKDRILNMVGGELGLDGLRLGSLPELPAGLARLDARRNELIHLPELPAGLTRLDVRDNGLIHLPELPADLTTLDVGCNRRLCKLPALPAGLKTLVADWNRLFELPMLPTGLAVLNVYANRLSELPALPESIKTLDVSCNRLTHWPALPAGLTTLDVSYTRLTHLPALPAGLEELDVSGNQLAQLPELPAGLKKLWADSSQLTVLPTLPASLTTLHVPSNRLAHLPPSVFSMPYEGHVNAEDNSFLPEFLKQAHTVMLAPGYNGPQIRFSKAFRLVDGAVRDWLSNDEQTQIRRWQAHSEEAHAAVFARFLIRLKADVNDNAEFKAGVAKWLTKLSQDGELRRLTFRAVQGATEACEDRVALTYNDLTKLSHAHAVSRGDYDNRIVEIVERGRGAFRLDALEKIARKKALAVRRNHEIEVYLAYQVKLRDQLHLPTDIANMHYFNYSRVTPQDLESAEQEVLSREREEFPQYFLVEWEPWQQVLARLNPEGVERAHQKLQDMLPSYDREVAARLASLGLPEDHETQAQVGVNLMKTQQLAVYGELTRELLRKRGEEALMDRILGEADRS